LEEARPAFDRIEEHAGAGLAGLVSVRLAAEGGAAQAEIPRRRRIEPGHRSGAIRRPAALTRGGP